MVWIHEVEMPTKTQLKNYIKVVSNSQKEWEDRQPSKVSIVLDFDLEKDEGSKKLKYILKFSGFDHREDMTFMK